MTGEHVLLTMAQLRWSKANSIVFSELVILIRSCFCIKFVHDVKNLFLMHGYINLKLTNLSQIWQNWWLKKKKSLLNIDYRKKNSMHFFVNCVKMHCCPSQVTSPWLGYLQLTISCKLIELLGIRMLLLASKVRSLSNSASTPCLAELPPNFLVVPARYMLYVIFTYIYPRWAWELFEGSGIIAI